MLRTVNSLFQGLLLLLITAPVMNAADSPLADAAEKSDWPRVAKLIKEKAEVNAAQADGMTALIWAAHHDHLASAKLLIDAGADAKTANKYGVSALSAACVNGNEEMVSALLKAGADANSTLRGGESVLMTAARTGKLGPVKTLLEHGAKIEAADRKGQSALMWAADEGNSEVVETLIAKGADVHARLKSGFTAMLFAARDGHAEVVRALLKAGVDANEAIEKGGGKLNGTSALILAVENGHFELAMTLIKAGANPNDERSGFTPLHVLTWVRKPNRGDDPDGQPPPDGSGSLTSLQFARELIKAGADVNYQLEKGAIGKLSMAGATAFLHAAKRADLPLMKLLVELGAKPLLANKAGTTPLIAAAGFGTTAPDEEAGTEDECLETVKWLLTLGADVNTVDQHGETAMHGAAYKSLPKMVQLLADRGAKIEIWNHKNKSGWTPLLIAEGFRPGNFKPSAETIAAIHKVMIAAGVKPPPPTPRPGEEKRGYEQ